VLLPRQTQQDRLDTVVRVFHAKLQELKYRLTKHDILGKVRAYVYIMEFQKWGFEREVCPWAISKYFGDLVSNTRA
jgi:hypothetical protein